MTGLEIAVLNVVANDYESVQTIREDLARSLGRTVSEPELIGALLRLADAGFVDAYSYSPERGSFERVAFRGGVPKELWFLASRSGLAELEHAT